MVLREKKGHNYPNSGLLSRLNHNNQSHLKSKAYHNPQMTSFLAAQSCLCVANSFVAKEKIQEFVQNLFCCFPIDSIVHVYDPTLGMIVPYTNVITFLKQMVH